MHERLVDPEEWIADLLARELTVDATFTYPHLVQAVAARLGDGATVDTVERVARPGPRLAPVVPVHEPEGRRGGPAASYSTSERRFLDAAHDTRHTRAPSPPGWSTRPSRPRPTARRRPGRRRPDASAPATTAVTVLVGPAGTGKTFTLDAIRAAYEQAGHR